MTIKQKGYDDMYYWNGYGTLQGCSELINLLAISFAISTHYAHLALDLYVKSFVIETRCPCSVVKYTLLFWRKFDGGHYYIPKLIELSE